MNNAELGKEVGKAVLSSTELSSIVFTILAQSEAVDDITVTEHAELFAKWDENYTGKAGTIVSYEGVLYRAKKDFAKGETPSKTSSVWKVIGNSAESFPNWSQPLGSHDAYKKGDTVTHNGKAWISEVQHNVWEPGVYGWTETNKEG